MQEISAATVQERISVSVNQWHPIHQWSSEIGQWLTSTTSAGGILLLCVSVAYCYLYKFLWWLRCFIIIVFDCCECVRYWRCASLVCLLFCFVTTLFCVNKDVYITPVHVFQFVVLCLQNARLVVCLRLIFTRVWFAISYLHIVSVVGAVANCCFLYFCRFLFSFLFQNCLTKPSSIEEMLPRWRRIGQVRVNAIFQVFSNSSLCGLLHKSSNLKLLILCWQTYTYNEHFYWTACFFRQHVKPIMSSHSNIRNCIFPSTNLCPFRP